MYKSYPSLARSASLVTPLNMSHILLVALSAIITNKSTDYLLSNILYIQIYPVVWFRSVTDGFYLYFGYSRERFLFVIIWLLTVVCFPPKWFLIPIYSYTEYSSLLYVPSKININWQMTTKFCRHTEILNAIFISSTQGSRCHSQEQNGGQASAIFRNVVENRISAALRWGLLCPYSCISVNTLYRFKRNIFVCNLTSKNFEIRHLVFDQ